jgi:phage gp29-like protein
MKTNIEDLEGIGLERDMAGYPTLYLPLEIMKRETTEAEEAYQMYLDLVTNVRRDEAEGLLLPAVFDDHGNRLYEFKLLSSSGTRQFDTSRIITRYESRMALTIMADFLLLGQQKQGSYALSETKARMFYQALTSVLDNIAETINSQAVPALFELNPWWDLEELPYIAHGKVELPNLEVLGEFIERLFKAGMKPFPDDRLENHLRGMADLPLRDTKKEPPRTEEKPADSEGDKRQEANPDPEEIEEGEEVEA